MYLVCAVIIRMSSVFGLYQSFTEPYSYHVICVRNIQYMFALLSNKLLLLIIISLRSFVFSILRDYYCDCYHQ